MTRPPILTPRQRAWLQYLADHGQASRGRRRSSACDDCAAAGWTEILPDGRLERLTGAGRLRLATPAVQGVAIFRSTRQEVPAWARHSPT